MDTTLLSTPAFQAALLAAAGAIAYWLKDIPALLVSWGKRFFISSMTVDSRDKFLFGALVEYMDEHPALRRVNQFTARTVLSNSINQNLEEDLRNGNPPKASLSPSEGLHIVKVNGKWLWLLREVQVGTSIFEKVTLSHWGRSPKFLENFLQVAIDSRVARESDALSVYIPNPFHGGDWTRARLGSRRPLSSVILKAGQSEHLLGDLSSFFKSRERYAELGIPWRRGYLLYGPPGTGKTSLVQALASELRLNVCMLSLASPVVSDDKVHTLLAGVPPRSLLLIEDVDAFFRQRDAASAKVAISFSGFLNALDGVATQEGTVLFMTTNHPELLDPALIRAGRIDEKVELGLCTLDQLQRLYLKFNPNPEAAQTFAKQHADKGLSAAQAQDMLLREFGADSKAEPQ